tara:strand:+ start:769 stop:876 length:108 start_codon:yes stop_codon:yes gene_type:complete
MSDWDEGYTQGVADCGRIGIVVVVLVIIATVLVLK